MHFLPDERVGLFIDGPSLHATCKALDLSIDFARLLALFRAKARLVSATYYAVVSDTEPCSWLTPLLDWLALNGFKTVVSRQREGARGAGRMAISLAVDSMMHAQALDHIVIVSGNECYRHLVATLQETGKRVSLLSTLVTRPPMVADALRRQADQFVDIVDLRSEIRR